MADRNVNLGGTDWTEEGLMPVDLNDTFDETINFAAKGTAQNAYQILQANNVFDNKDFLATDEFVDSDGTNNTVNTGSSTGLFDTDHYELDGANPLTNDESSGDTAHSVTDGFGGTWSATNIFDADDGTFSSRDYSPAHQEGATQTNNPAIGKTFSAKFVRKAKVKIELATTGSDFATLKLQKYNGSTWSDVVTLATNNGSYDNEININESIEGLRIVRTTGRTVGGGGDSTSMDIYTLAYTSSYASTSTVAVDSNTLTLDGTEKSICIYTDTVHTANTSMTVDISDGTTTISAQAITNNTTGVVDISSLSSGTLELTFNLATTDTSETPEFRGYGVYIMRY